MSHSVHRALVALVFTSFASFPGAVHASDACSIVPVPPGTGVGAWDLFGHAVAWTGDGIVVGAPYSNGPSTGSWEGSAFVYRWQGGAWVETQQVGASNGSNADAFGWALAAAGDFLFVGAPFSAVLGSWHNGTVYVFQEQGTSWVEVRRLSPTIVNAEFGYSVAADGRWLVVGAPGERAGGFNGAGAAYVYERLPSGAWVRDQRLVAPNGAADDHFGRSVSISGERIVVGAPTVDLDLGSSVAINVGAAYIFERSAQGWVLASKVMSPAPTFQSVFGRSVALRGDRLVVGAPREYITSIIHSGAAYVFTRDGSGAWRYEATLVPSEAESGLFFGQAVALEGDLIAVGAPGWDHPLADDAGRVYVFRREGGAWSEVTRLCEGVPADDDERFGETLALRGGAILVGELQDAVSGLPRGGAYVFPDADAPPGTELCFCDSGPCGNPYGVGGCLNSTGAGAWLHACGSASVTLDDLVLVAEQVPAAQLGILYMGPVLGSTPFGDGTRCVFPGGGVGVYRYPARSSGPEGVLSEGPGLVAFSRTAFPPQGFLRAGDTWYFQAWFRDPLGPCGSGFNTSNAVEVTFEP